jgi:hypothetical protein
MPLFADRIAEAVADSEVKFGLCQVYFRLDRSPGREMDSSFIGASETPSISQLADRGTGVGCDPVTPLVL